jgi:hypothetical protein
MIGGGIGSMHVCFLMVCMNILILNFDSRNCCLLSGKLGGFPRIIFVKSVVCGGIEFDEDEDDKGNADDDDVDEKVDDEVSEYGADEYDEDDDDIGNDESDDEADDGAGLSEVADDEEADDGTKRPPAPCRGRPRRTGPYDDVASRLITF